MRNHIVVQSQRKLWLHWSGVFVDHTPAFESLIRRISRRWTVIPMRQTWWLHKAELPGTVRQSWHKRRHKSCLRLRARSYKADGGHVDTIGSRAWRARRRACEGGTRTAYQCSKGTESRSRRLSQRTTFPRPVRTIHNRIRPSVANRGTSTVARLHSD